MYIGFEGILSLWYIFSIFKGVVLRLEGEETLKSCYYFNLSRFIILIYLVSLSFLTVKVAEKHIKLKSLNDNMFEVNEAVALELQSMNF